MQYMFLIYQDDTTHPQPGTPDWDVLMDGFHAFTSSWTRPAKLVGAAPLKHTATATTVRVTPGGAVTTDGPFAETKEQLGGFFLVEAKDIDEACAVAARFPPARLGTIEVRPVQELEHS